MFSSSLSNSLPKPMRWLTIWVNQGMLPYSLHIIRPLMCDFKYVPHFLCTLALGDPTKLIHVQRWREDALCIAIILSSSPFFFCPFSPRLVHLLIFNNTFRGVRSIHNCIPNPLVYWFNENFHSNFPKLVVYTIKHRRPMNRSTFCKR